MALTIQIAIDVTGETAGTPGVARDFTYAKLGTAPTVTFRLGDVTGVNSYSWQFVDIPSGSSAVLSSSTAAQPTFTPDLDGTYLVQCTVNEGETYARNAIAFRTQFKNFRKPAAGETVEFDTVKGWQIALNELFDLIDVAIDFDADAVHVNLPSEINAITEKINPSDADVVVIEDSADSYNKKRMRLDNIRRSPSKIRTINSNDSILITNETILLDGSSNSVTATLPTAVGYSGYSLEIKAISIGTTYTVELDTTGAETIDSESSYTFIENESVKVKSDGSNWFIF